MTEGAFAGNERPVIPMEREVRCWRLNGAVSFAAPRNGPQLLHCWEVLASDQVCAPTAVPPTGSLAIKRFHLIKTKAAPVFLLLRYRDRLTRRFFMTDYSPVARGIQICSDYRLNCFIFLPEIEKQDCQNRGRRALIVIPCARFCPLGTLAHGIVVAALSFTELIHLSSDLTTLSNLPTSQSLPSVSESLARSFFIEKTAFGDSLVCYLSLDSRQNDVAR